MLKNGNNTLRSLKSGSFLFSHQRAYEVWGSPEMLNKEKTKRNKARQKEYEGELILCIDLYIYIYIYIYI